MKRFFSALSLCVSLLAVLSFWLYPAVSAKEDAIITLLNLPAPPPPNPLVTSSSGSRPPEFYKKSSPPADGAPIEELMDYWSRMSSGYQELGYNPRPSAAVVDRLMREVERDPTKIGDLLNVLPDDRRAADLARDLYSKMSAGSMDDDAETRSRLKQWLMNNTSDFSGELEKKAAGTKDVGEYVTNQDELLSLTRVDWERAAPIVNRLYGDKGQKVSQVLATWALYKRAMESGGSDVDRYRDELKAVVENKEATDGMRDLALDALIKEKEWGGRDDWYVSLMADETLHELKVDGRIFTGLTTLMYYTPDEQYIDRMVGLAASDNIWVRTAAAKNLLLRLGRLGSDDESSKMRTEIVRTLLPWLSDPKWINAETTQRVEIVRALQFVKMPESVPALIAALDEKEATDSPRYLAMANAANAVANAMNLAANAVNSASASFNSSNAANSVSWTSNTAANSVPSRAFYPLRSPAITSLGYQADMRAAPALRRVFPQVEEWERTVTVKSLLACNGFTTEEQIEAIEFLAASAGDVANDSESAAFNYDGGYSGNTADRAKMAVLTSIASHRTVVTKEAEDEEVADREFDTYDGGVNQPATNSVHDRDTHHYVPPEPKPLDETELKYLVGSQLVSIDDPSENLIRAMADRIVIHDKRDPVLAQTLRKIMLGWKGTAVNALLLRDLKAGKLDADAILKLLSIRKTLREKQLPDVTDIRTGGKAAIGIAACLLEEKADYDAILTNGSDETKIALLACGRLIRAPLPVQKAALLIKSPNRILAVGAERFLESEDSPEARSVVLSLYPNQAKVLGATIAFDVAGLTATPGEFLRDVFASVNPYFVSSEYGYVTFGRDAELSQLERDLQKEVTANPELLGVYAYDWNFVRMYKDKAVFSWEDDPARYRERVLDAAEFDSLKTYLANFGVDRLPPFLVCSGECDSMELLMLGKQGGRRVFVKADKQRPEFFAGLEAFFEEMKRKPAKLKYYAMAKVPGLEVLFADEKLDARSVWKSGADLRVLITDDARRKAIEREVDRLSEEAAENTDEEEPGRDSQYMKFYKMREMRRFESFIWHRLANETLAETAPQPREAEYIPVRDNSVPSSAFGQWKAKAGTIELRADETGLYKLTGSRSTKIKTGNYSEPVVTSNGRWAIVSKYDDQAGPMLMRIDLATGREYKVESGDLSVHKALAYIPSRNLVLVTSYGEEDDHHDEGYDNEYYLPAAHDNGTGYYFLNPDNGVVSQTVGEVRPLAQQTFRSLQPTGTPGEYYAALPRGNAGTIVGVYSTKTFSFKPILKLPKIVFDSTEMWVDANKLYFAYQGHLLTVPIVLQNAMPR